MTDGTSATLQKFLRSAEAKRILETEEQRESERRAGEETRIKAQIVAAEQDHEEAMANVNTQIANATEAYEQALRVYNKAQVAVSCLSQERLRCSLRHDGVLSDLTRQLAAITEAASA